MVAVREQIFALLKRKASALVSQSAPDLTEIIDDGFLYINSQGKKSDKKAYIDLCTVGTLKFRSQEIDELEVRDFGTFALASMILHDEFEYSGQPYKGSFRSLCIFKKIGNRFFWVGGQTNEI